MNALLKRLSANPAVQTLLHRESGLGNLSATEEALLLAAAFDQDPQTMIVVKNNTYTAQRLQERLEPLLHDKALLFVMEESDCLLFLNVLYLLEAVLFEPNCFVLCLNV